MKIKILGTESLGVRGLCCVVETENQKFLFDPGVALGYSRYNLLPHPVQVAIDEAVRERIVQAWAESTDIVISHFHGDHVPLFHANPYQLSVDRVAPLAHNKKIWAKLTRLSPREHERADHLASIFGDRMAAAEGTSRAGVCFSAPVPHGSEKRSPTVMMSRVEGQGVFVHASDIQLLNDEAVEQIIAWKADIVLLSGPPLYLSGKVSGSQNASARRRAEKLADNAGTVIIDHHMLRDSNGIRLLEELRSETGRNIMCAADYMGEPRMFLEAQRRYLYRKMPVPEGWHARYAIGREDPSSYLQDGLDDK